MAETRKFKWSNNTATTLAGAVAPGDGTITVVDGSGFPLVAFNEICSLVLRDDTAQKFEIVYLTSRAGNVLTVERGAEGTSAFAWPVGTKIRLSLTAAWFEVAISPTYTYLTSLPYPYQYSEAVGSTFDVPRDPTFVDVYSEAAESTFSITGGVLTIFAGTNYTNAKPEGVESAFSVSSGVFTVYTYESYTDAKPEGVESAFSVSSGVFTVYTYEAYVDAKPEGVESAFSVISGVLT